MRYLLASLLRLALVAAFPQGAAAHAYLDHSQPADGAVVTAVPTTVKLWFSRAVEPAFSTISVIDARGTRMDDGKATVNAATPKLIEVALNKASAGRSYKVIYRPWPWAATRSRVNSPSA
jgi:methionine-rich copper-binding protein CopC